MPGTITGVELFCDSKGATRDGDVHVWGGTRAAWFKDPDGSILAVVGE